MLMQALFTSSIFVAIALLPNAVHPWPTVLSSVVIRARGHPMMIMSTSTRMIEHHAPRRVVIVGGGVGSLSSAHDARHILPKDHVIVISANDLFQFTPSNPWVATRKRTPEEISLPLRTILPRHKIEFIHGVAKYIDPQQQQLTLQDGCTVPYDYLIIATGPKLAFDEIPGMKESSESICTTPHAAKTAEALDRLVADPGPIVIGATQGASCFGPAYEFALLVHYELQRRGGKALREKCKITLVTPEPYVGHLGLGGAGDSQSLLEGLLNDNNIDFYTNCRVNHVASDSVYIEYLVGDEDHQLIERRVLDSKFTMLIPPFRGPSVWSSVPGLTDKHGMISVNAQQQSFAYPNIFAVGVCVSLPPPPEETWIPIGVPKTGYMIESMGTAAVQNIKFLMDASSSHSHHEDVVIMPLPHTAVLNGVCITDFGNDGAVFVTLPQIPPRRVDLTLHGKVGTLAKIAFEKYFLHKIDTGDMDPYYEKYMLHLAGIDRTTMSSAFISSKKQTETE